MRLRRIPGVAAMALVVGGFAPSAEAAPQVNESDDPPAVAVLPPPPPPPAPAALYLELPLVDLPFVTANGGSAPSMEQSLWVTADLYQAMHYGLGRLADPFGPFWSQRLLGKLAIAAADVLTVAVPGFLAWQHEEWHRAVMSWRGIDSYDDVYKLKLFSNVINVSHVSDADLIRLKAEHPADQVRMSTAGIEANYAGAHALENAAFFHGTRTWNTFLLWLLYIQNSAYMSGCASTDSDRSTAEEQRAEGSDVARRDFTGLDCNGWTYDLFRPDEPYTARGIHPSGVGIDRYRSYSAMAPEEQAYLRRQSRLSLLNFIDPNLVGVSRIRLPGTGGGGRAPLEVNLAIRHLPAAFGYDVRADVFARRDEAFGALLTLHAYFNQVGPSPGIELQLFRQRAGTLAGAPLVLGLRGSFWRQPEGLRFDSRRGVTGGLGSVRAAWALAAGFEPYLELEAKAAGWVAGNVFLDRNVSLRMGAVARF